MKRKTVAIVLVAAMSCSLAACGSSGTSSTTAATDSAAATSEAAASTDSAAAASTTEEAAAEASSATLSVDTSAEDEHTLSLACWDANFNVPAMQAAADDYKANVDPDFNLNIIEQSGSSDIENAVTLAASAGDYSTLPDIVLFQDHYFQKYNSDYPDAWQDVNDADVNWDDFSQEKLSFSTVDGVHYGLPVDNGTVIFAYRTDILEQCGYTIDDVTGITWDKFDEIGKDVYAKTGKYLLSMDGDGNDLPYMMLQAEGSSQFKDGKPYITENDKLVKIIDVIKKLSDDNVLYLANDWSDYTDQTIMGDMVAGVMNGNWIIPTIEQVKDNSGKWAITTMPTLSGDEGYASNGGSSLYVTANCKNLDLAKKFLAYTFGGSTETYDNALRNGGVITTCISAGKSDVYNEGVDYFGGQAIYAKIVEMGSHTQIVEQSDYHYTCRQYMAAAIQNIIGGADVTTSLQDAEDQLNFAMGN